MYPEYRLKIRKARLGRSRLFADDRSLDYWPAWRR
jgi:hypothetical protein